MEQLINLKAIVATVVFSVIGIVVLAVCFILFDKFTPGDLWKEIVEEHNMALAISAGAMTIAMAMIISAAIHG